MKPRIVRALVLAIAMTLVAAACGDASDSGDAADAPIVIGAIPDQDPEVLVRNFGLLADYLSETLGRDVEFQPVTEYEAAVTSFRVGDLDLVWFGALTGVQARLQVEGAEAIAQRNIDREFTSIFIAGTDTGIEPVTTPQGLSVLAGRSLTFGSDSSTSGRLMPQFFMEDAGVMLEDLAGEPGFSGSHDATIELVEAGSFEVGVVSSQIWRARVEAGEVDLSKVQAIFETPPYFNYHWVARPELDEGLRSDILDAFTSLDPSNPDDAILLDFFGATSFIGTENSNYDSIESVGRSIGKIDE